MKKKKISSVVPSQERIDQLLAIVAEGPITMPELASRMLVCVAFARNTARFIHDFCNNTEGLANLVVQDRFNKQRQVKYTDSLQQYRDLYVQAGIKRCIACKLPGQMLSPSSNTCTSCMDKKGEKIRSSVGHLDNDPRWNRIVERKHHPGHCIVCGSPKAKDRDDRYCNWRHDVVMLTTSEVNDLLEVYGYDPESRDIWGRLVTRA